MMLRHAMKRTTIMKISCAGISIIKSAKDDYVTREGGFPYMLIECTIECNVHMVKDFIRFLPL